MADSIKIRIDGDASGVEKELKAVERTASSAAVALAQQYRKAGDNMSNAMTRAWAEVRQAYASGNTIMINGVETVIRANRRLEDSIKDTADEAFPSLERESESASRSVRADFVRMESAAQSTGRGIRSAFTASIRGITAVTAAVSAAWSAVGLVGVKYNASIEQLRTSFEVMTGSAEKGAEVLERIRRLGAETPFETEGLASTVQLLMNYNLTADDAIERMTMLGDIAQGDQDKLTRIATAYGQMSSAGKVSLEDVKQMIEAGFNPLAEISETTGESMASLYERISRGTIAVDEITASMERSTSVGGKYFQSMEKQSQTLNGQLSTLKDNAMSLLGDVMTPFTDELRDQVLPMANGLLGEFSTAFSTGGLDGLLDAVTGQIPALLNTVLDAGETVIDGVVDWLPGAFRQISGVIPNLLRSVLDMGPQIVSALFDVASSLVSDLITMLPQLVPMIIGGVVNLGASILDGVGDVLGGVFEGIERMFHQGQTKIAGVWVDQEEVAKYDFGLITEAIDTSETTDEITSAYAEIREALETGPLTDEQQAAIMGMIGEDYQTVYDALIGFNLPPADAEVLASQITASADVIQSRLAELDVGADQQQLLKWMVQANDSRIALREILKAQGLSDGDVEEVVSLFDTMTGRIKGSTPNVAEEIYATLTDGLSDDKEALKGQVENYIATADAAIDEAYNNAVSKLDPNDSDYAAKLAALQETYNTAKADLNLIASDLDTLVDTLANASTATVQGKFEQFADIERRIEEVSGKIDELNGKMMEQAEQAFRVVRSGANADQTTVEMAIDFAFSDYTLDVNSAEEAYRSAIDELNRRLAEGEISVDEYNTGESDAGSARDAALAAAKAEYETRVREILMGLAASEGNAAALEEAMKASNLSGLISEFLDSMFSAGDGAFNAEGFSALNEALAEYLGEAYDPEAVARNVERTLTMNGQDPGAIQALLTQYIAEVEGAAGSAAGKAISGKVGEAWAAMLEKGILAGTSFDTSDADEQLAALAATSANSYATALSGQEGALTDAADSASSGIPGAMDVSDETYGSGRNTVSGYIRGVNSMRGPLTNAMRSLARAALNAHKSELGEQSPSKEFRKSGQYSVEGYILGFSDRIRSAQRTVRNLTGTLLSASAVQSRGASAAAADASADADPLSRLSVGLYVSDRKIAEATADANARVSNARSRRVAAGLGHV